LSRQAVLTDEQDVAVGVDGCDGDDRGVLDDLSEGGAAVRQFDRVLAQSDDAAVVDAASGDDAFGGGLSLAWQG